MKLQILISQYDNETNKVVKPLLDSIAIQQNINFNEVGVIIVNDGSKTKLDEEWLRTYPFQIDYMITEHGGVGHARNAGLDAAVADYVMFCDADDMFFNICGLWMVFEEIKKGEFDIMVSQFVEEIRAPNTDDAQYVTHENDCTFIHGKILRRAYLNDNNIRWNESIECHGDSYFNCLAQNLTENWRYCPNTFYLWKWRQESVCRSDPDYILKTYPDFLNSSRDLAREFLRRGKRDKAEFYAISTVYENYYALMRPQWLKKENIVYRVSAMFKCRDFWNEFKELLTTIPQDALFSTQKKARDKYFDECGTMELYTFTDWTRQLEELST